MTAAAPSDPESPSHPASTTVSASTVAKAFADAGRTLIVLDDDPTGTQSVADLPVLTRWEVSDYVWALDQGAEAIYVLTNTRSVDPAEAIARNRSAVRHALAAADGRPLGFVSRSDSTLRGHFPLETDVISDELEAAGLGPVDGVVIVPAFPDAGRVTIGGIHYVRSGGELVPAAETEFARDLTFGYTQSDLSLWVEEKTRSRTRAAEVLVVELATVRAGSEAVAAVLGTARGRQPIVVDAVDEDDLRRLALGLDLAESRGRRFVHRVGPPFVRARIGQSPRPPLTSAAVARYGAGAVHGGLIVVGSHVGQTSRQLDALRRDHPTAGAFELDARVAASDDDATLQLAALASDIARELESRDVILSSSRTVVRGDGPDQSLAISRRVSDALMFVVRAVVALRTPRFVLAKGGITSSDTAVHGLDITRAFVRGSMLPGLVALWEPAVGPGHGIPFIVFPGNVGDNDALADVVRTLTRTEAPAADA